MYSYCAAFWNFSDISLATATFFAKATSASSRSFEFCCRRPRPLSNKTQDISRAMFILYHANKVQEIMVRCIPLLSTPITQHNNTCGMQLLLHREYEKQAKKVQDNIALRSRVWKDLAAFAFEVPYTTEDMCLAGTEQLYAHHNNPIMISLAKDGVSIQRLRLSTDLITSIHNLPFCFRLISFLGHCCKELLLQFFRL